MIRSETISEFTKAFIKAQAEMEKASKSSENPFFSNRYADLEEVISTVKGPLNRNNIAFVQTISTEEETMFVETFLIHESGEFISSKAKISLAKPNDPQALGSLLSYFKRYQLQAITGLPTTDDDAESAMVRDENQSVNKSSILSEVIQGLKKREDGRQIAKQEANKYGKTMLKDLNADQLLLIKKNFVTRS